VNVSAYAIYGLIDPCSGELRYVGKSVDSAEGRLSDHLSESRRGYRTHRHNWLRQLLAAGLKPDIEVLETHETAEALVEAERHFIAYFRSVGCRLTNATDGGEGMLGFKHSAESRRRISDAKKNPSREVRQRLATAGLGKRHSEQTRKKMSLAHRGQRVVDEAGAIYPSSYAAAQALNVPRGSVWKVLKGQYSHAGGHKFKYVEEACRP
jgi:hypothetical protein